MVTLSSYMIWQTICFTLPPNEYVCIYASLSGPAIGIQKMPILEKKIIFTDEADYDLGGYVNKLNFRIWGTGNPHAYIEKPTHPKLVTVWLRILALALRKWALRGRYSQWRSLSGHVGRFFVAEEDIDNIWFQQDDATCHTAEGTLDVLSPVFEDRIISRRADVVWPPRSCNLTPFNYYLCGAIKN